VQFCVECTVTRPLRGCQRDPDTSAPSEEAFQTAIAVAKKQAARSFGLRAPGHLFSQLPLRGFDL
jgi:hypothetical protein